MLTDGVEMPNNQIHLKTENQSQQQTVDCCSSALAKSDEEEHYQKDIVWQHYYLMLILSALKRFEGFSSYSFDQKTTLY